MTYLILLAALAVVPVLAIVLLRVNGAIAFMSLALGSLLVAYTAGDITDLVTSFSAKGTLDVSQWVKLALLAAPFVLTLLFAHGSVKGSKKLMNILPALATGALVPLLAVPLMPAGVQRQVHALSVWHQLDSLQTAVILAGTVFSLLFLLFTHRTHGHEESNKKHSKH